MKIIHHYKWVTKLHQEITIHHPLHNYHKYIKQIKLFRVGFLLWVFSTKADKTLYQIQLRTFLWVHSRCPLPLGSAVFCWSSSSQLIMLFPRTLQLYSFTKEGSRGIVQNEPGHPLASQALTQNVKEHTRTLLQPTYSNSHRLSGCVGRVGREEIQFQMYVHSSTSFTLSTFVGGPEVPLVITSCRVDKPLLFLSLSSCAPYPAPGSLPAHPHAPVCFNPLC